MHQAAYLRNSLAHSDKPSLAEGVAGVAAMRDVLSVYDDHSTAEQLQAIVVDMQALAWLEQGSTIDMGLKDTLYASIMLEAALQEISTVLGQCCSQYWHPPEDAPHLPMEASNIVKQLRNSNKGGHENGKNPCLKVSHACVPAIVLHA